MYIRQYHLRLLVETKSSVYKYTAINKHKRWLNCCAHSFKSCINVVRMYYTYTYTRYYASYCTMSQGLRTRYCSTRPPDTDGSECCCYFKLLLPLALPRLLLGDVHERISAAAAAAAALISLVDLQQLHFEVEISIGWNHTACSFAAVAVVASDVQLALLAKRHLQCNIDQRSHKLTKVSQQTL
jgi:hypothetical protein